MGERLEYSRYLQKQREERESLQEAAIKAEREEKYNIYSDLESLRENAKIKRDNFIKYKNDVKNTLVTEALLNIYTESMNNPSQWERSLCEAFLGQYIKDTGVDNLIRRMKNSNDIILNTIYENVNKYYDKITEDAELDKPETQVIDKDNVKEFWKEIDNCEDVADATNIIRLRVSNAEEDFINKNHQDKENIDTILKDTANRIQLAKSNNDNDYSSQVEESETRLAKSKIYKIQHEGRTNVFDRMVRNLSEVVIGTESLKKDYTLENGRLNVDKVVDTTRCMYTLLEMVSTLQLENVDDKYIEDTLKSIKK